MRSNNPHAAKNNFIRLDSSAIRRGTQFTRPLTLKQLEYLESQRLLVDEEAEDLKNAERDAIEGLNP